MKLTERSINFLKLLQRSNDAGDGWRYYSPMTAPLVTDFYRRHPELLEIKFIERACRLTERGKIVMEYLV